MKLSIIIPVLIFLAGCATNEQSSVDSLASQEHQAAVVEKARMEQLKAKQMEIEQEQERQKQKELENKKIDAEYVMALKTNKCEKQYWSRYEFGEYFQTIASRNKITPHDVIYGDAYTRRNISRAVWSEAFENLVKYSATHMPDAIKNKFEQEFEDEAKKNQNQKSVFNVSIKRDYECYKKLK